MQQQRAARATAGIDRQAGTEITARHIQQRSAQQGDGAQRPEFDPAANAFWSQAAHAQRLSQTLLLDVTSITNIGILGGALWVAAGERRAAPKPLSARQWAVGLLAGFLMGYSARLALGCNVGAMLSGISTGSLHGWIWVPVAFAGTLIGVRVRRHFGY